MRNVTIIKNYKNGIKLARKRTLEQLMKLPYKIELTPISLKDGGGFLTSTGFD